MPARALDLGFTDDVLAALRARLDALEVDRVTSENPRSAAVLVPLCEIDGVPSVLFTKRSESVGTHKGQVSFPGGRRDQDDASHEVTALRELHEELGVAPDRVDVLGRLHEARAITGVRVITVVGALGAVQLDSLRPSEAEIDHVFAVSLADLVDPKRRYMQTLSRGIDIPVYDAGPYPIWGLTSWILTTFLTEGLGLDLAPAEG